MMQVVRFNPLACDRRSSTSDAESCSTLQSGSTADNTKWITSLVKVERRGREDMIILREEDGICKSSMIMCSRTMQTIRRRHLRTLLFTYVTILLSLCLTGAGANLNVIWCLDASEERLLNLSCGSASLIRINSVSHGWRNAGQAETTVPAGGCLLPTQDICAEKYPNVRLLLDTCSGLSSCVVSSLEMSAPLSSCSGRRSNYVFITYECLLLDNEASVVNICDNPLKPSGVLRTTVYVTSPNYPKNYDANTKCSCFVSTSSSSPVDGDQQQEQDGSEGSGARSTEVVLQLMDFDVSLVPNELSPFDWIQYGREGRNWGDGRLIGTGGTSGGRSPLVIADQIFTGSDRVDVDFNTDEQREGRGFWIKVIGLNITSKEQVPVEIECGLYTPPDSRQALSCFEPPRSGELYLSCTAYGVINVLSIRSGYRHTVNQTKVCTADDVIKQANCMSEVTIAAIEDQCMRRTTCNPPAPSNVNITAACGAGHSSDFVLVDYQCIPDSSQSGNIVNVCGDDMAPGTTLVRPSGSGFISSPLYPSNYPPDCNCFCRLEVTSSTLQSSSGTVGQLVFYVLDLQFSRATDEELGNRVCSSTTSGCSNNDWLQYGSAGQIPGTGRNLSMEEKRKPVYTGSNVVVIAFQSDSQMEDRGFWIKYVGRSVDGSNAPVVVQCGRFAPQSDPGVNGTGPTSDTSSPTATNGEDGVNQSPDERDNSKTGLIVGVTVSVIIVLVALLALIAFFLYRRRKRIKSGKILDESKTNSWSSRTHGMPGFSSPAASDGGGGGSSEKKEKLFSGWKRGNNKTRPIDKPHSPPFAIFYNEAYKMQDPTLYRNLHSSTARKKRISPAEETVHF